MESGQQYQDTDLAKRHSTMISDIDFYDLSEEEQRRLINRNRVAASGTILVERPTDDLPVRVFEKSLSEYILDRLETGQYSLAELADEFGVRQEDIRGITSAYRKRSKSTFGGNHTKMSLLQERKGVIRVGKNEGSSSYYTLEKIPYFARLVDPTLCVSLLNIDNRLEKFPELTGTIPAGKASGLDEEYALVIGEFWEIDPQEVFDQITSYDRKYVETTLMPFPIVDAPDEYQAVEDRFRQPDGTYNRFRIDNTAIEKLGEYFVERASEQRVGIVAYQEIAIEFADLKWYAQIKKPRLLRTVDAWFENILQTLNPEIEPVLGSEVDASDQTADDQEGMVSLEDRVLSNLSPEPQTAQQLYQSWPPRVLETTELEETREVLTGLADLGVIDRTLEGGVKKYSSKSGKVVVSADNKGGDL